MPKYLSLPCDDVQFLGFKIYQYRNPEDEKWYAFFEIQSQLVDVEGNVMTTTNPTDDRVLLNTGADSPLTLHEMMSQMSIVFKGIEARLIKCKIVLAGRSQDDLLAEGHDKKLIEEISE